VRLEAGSEVVRIHHAAFGAIWFGPERGAAPAYRFDAPGGEYRTCYAAESLDGAFAETILHGRAGTRFLAKAFIHQRAFSTVRVERDLTLAKLCDDGLFWHGTEAGISASIDYTEPRRLALNFFQEVLDLDGIVYRARHNNGEYCYALFDRVKVSQLTVVKTQRFDRDPKLADDLAAKYGAVFDPSPWIAPPAP
jgi:hypothetical protein